MARERERERERETERERESQRDRERERERGRETLGACDPSTLDPDPRPQTFAVLYHPAAPRSPSALSLSLSAPALGPRPAALRARLACESWVIRHGVMGHGPWAMGHGSWVMEAWTGRARGPCIAPCPMYPCMLCGFREACLKVYLTTSEFYLWLRLRVLLMVLPEHESVWV